MIFKKYSHIDWVLFLATLPLLALGLMTMNSFGAQSDYFFGRQLVWIAIAFAIFFVFSFLDWRVLKRGEILIALYLFIVFLLLPLLLLGNLIRGVSSWYDLAFFSIQPADPAKLVLVLIMAKYFSRRHVEIAHIKHLIISAVYAGIFCLLIFFQPDFGSALVLFLIWLGMVLVSGINKKHLLAVFLIGALVIGASWVFVLKPYQKNRIVNFLHPLNDIKGTGYNAFQSTIAVGSGQILGKGVGFGTQSRLEFLPEHQTDFIFAAFAEEWGMLGVVFFFLFYGIVIWRIIQNAMKGHSNFEAFFGLGMAIFLMAHFIIHVGMNIGVMPVTGIGLPFLSYGGSLMITVYSGLGILMGMRRYSRQAHPEDLASEFLGPR